MIGVLDGGPWGDSYAFSGDTLIQQGRNRLRAYQLNRFRTQLEGDTYANGSVRLKDVGDGVHAVRIYFTSGRVELMDIGAGPRVVHSFQLPPVSLDKDGNYVEDLSGGMGTHRRMGHDRAAPSFRARRYRIA